MPLYEYECERGHRFERIVKFSDPPLEVCPECGAVVHKLMSSPAIQFKGTGWYITDYARKGGESKDTKSTKSSSEAGESKDSKESKESKESKDSSESKSEKPSTAEATSAKATPTTPASTKSD
jgi:putative FmdB family regulatory protein